MEGEGGLIRIVRKTHTVDAKPQESENRGTKGEGMGWEGGTETDQKHPRKSIRTTDIRNHHTKEISRMEEGRGLIRIIRKPHTGDAKSLESENQGSKGRMGWDLLNFSLLSR